ncbi:MAG: hypothetical protein CMP38_00675 [Rickettsiales bacterium]|nr:hypothetical protein [Rickettsiales bacterium]
MSKTLNLASFFLLFIIVFVVIIMSPSLFSSVQPDSSSYQNFHSYRTAIYPNIIFFLDYFGVDIIFFQKFLFSLSVCFFLNSFVKVNIFFPILLILVIFNLFYTSFSNSILTESLFFSFINFALAILLSKKSNIFLTILLGIFVGLIITIKPVGFAIAIPIIIFYILKFYKSANNKIITFILFLSLIIFIENRLFFLKHDKRNSVLDSVVTGKLITLASNKNFQVDKYPSEIRELVNEAKSDFSKVDLYLSKIKNPLLRAELRADYEVIAQYQYLEYKFNDDKKSIIEDIIQENYIDYFFEIIRNNFFEYLKLSTSHYIGMWSSGNKTINFLEKEVNNNKPPFFDLLQNSSNKVEYVDIRLLKLTSLYFIILFFTLIFFTFQIISNRKSFSPDFIFIVFMIQFYLICVSLSNVATIRYLMPIYPYLLYLNYIYFSRLTFFNLKI